MGMGGFTKAGLWKYDPGAGFSKSSRDTWREKRTYEPHTHRPCECGHSHGSTVTGNPGQMTTSEGPGLKCGGPR